MVDACAYTMSHSAFFGVATVSIFSSVNKTMLMLMSLDEYFSATVSNDQVCITVCFTQLCSMAVVEHKQTFHKVLQQRVSGGIAHLIITLLEIYC